MSANHSEVVGKHGRRSSKKPVLFLRVLLLETVVLLELGILSDLVKNRSDLRVQHLEVWKILSTD